MAAPRNLGNESVRVVCDEEDKKFEDSPSSKKPKLDGKFPPSRWEFAAALGVFVIFSTGLICIYLTIPAADYGKIKVPRTISDLRELKKPVLSYLPTSVDHGDSDGDEL